MKKSIFLAVGLLFCAASIFAQQTSVGLRVGYTLSDVLVKEPDGLIVEGNPDIEFDEDYRPLHSFHTGIDSRFQFSERFGIIASLLYGRKGYTGTIAWPTGIADATWKLHYLNLPVVADFRLWKGLYLQGGAEAGWLIDAQVDSRGESFDPRNAFSNINELDFGLVGGLEYRFPKGFFIGARYIFGIAPLQRFDAVSYNRATQVSMGYRHVMGE